MDKSPLQSIINLFQSKEILFNSEIGRKINRLEIHDIENAKSLFNVKFFCNY